ncbi:hypothetical protein CAPTEDRAFT_145964 [Capitella teleta]|uniref:Metalloendopeptidase n=1 Tax=Capitella teleta TaxID=283909 RepID=X1Z4F1_CAPTE|nr:hypothetical protein CAPTEDRAFT_145964 [Capitella teleta]|eukprot:ELU00287.1 hypothetical protein CAPTEDRAFT_145964 [Capitella teleta]
MELFIKWLNVPGRFEFFEGDIVLKSAARTKRAIIRPISKLWKFGIVPYVLDSSLTTSAKRYIGAAIRSFERKTCIRFIPKSKEHVDYIMFINQPGCWSYVGKQGGEQHVSLGAGCDNFGTVLHETAHALGFWHEQSRPDRDTFVKLIKKNIPSRFLSQFGKRDSEESSTRGYAYDYDSIMHYGERYFSSNNRATLKVSAL